MLVGGLVVNLRLPEKTAVPENDSIGFCILFIDRIEFVLYIFKCWNFRFRQTPGNHPVKFRWIGKDFRDVKAPATVQRQAGLMQAILYRLVNRTATCVPAGVLVVQFVWQFARPCRDGFLHRT